MICTINFTTPISSCKKFCRLGRQFQLTDRMGLWLDCPLDPSLPKAHGADTVPFTPIPSFNNQFSIFMKYTNSNHLEVSCMMGEARIPMLFLRSVNLCRQRRSVHTEFCCLSIAQTASAIEQQWQFSCTVKFFYHVPQRCPLGFLL